MIWYLVCLVWNWIIKRNWLWFLHLLIMDLVCMKWNKRSRAYRHVVHIKRITLVVYHELILCQDIGLRIIFYESRRGMHIAKAWISKYWLMCWRRRKTWHILERGRFHKNRKTVLTIIFLKAHFIAFFTKLAVCLLIILSPWAYITWINELCCFLLICDLCNKITL